MLCLVWFLVAAEVLGTSFELSVWEAHLKAIDSSLPTTVVENYKVCYYFDLAQTCAKDAIGAFLHVTPITNVLTWTPTVADCSNLLDKQRPSLNRAAISLFGTAITSSATAGVTNFELLAQSWVLRVSHHALSVKQEAFVAAINSISDWKTVHCDGANLLYDGKSITKPDFVGAVDCDILDTVHADICASGSCTQSEGGACCESNKSSACCQAQLSSIESECSKESCDYKVICCSLDSASSCCTGIPFDPCVNGSCTLAEGTTCCGSNKSSACCQAHLSAVQSECSSNALCAYKSTCCSLDSASACCTRTPPNPCANGSCTLAEGTTCCVTYESSACCQTHLSAIQSECSSNISCAYKSTCCSLDIASACCTGILTPTCTNPSNPTCTATEAIACCVTDLLGSCCQVNIPGFLSSCVSDINCPYESFCCDQSPQSACCSKYPLGHCDNGACDLTEGIVCCKDDSATSCCQSHYMTLIDSCASNASCPYKDYCCSVNPTMTCCLGPTPAYCETDQCTMDEANTCCTYNMVNSCCQANMSAIQTVCHDNSSCPYKSLCCALLASFPCCSG